MSLFLLALVQEHTETTGMAAKVAAEFFNLAAETAPFLFLGFFAAGLLKVFVPAKLITSQLGGEGLWPVTKAGLIGVPLPLCSCSVIPTAAGLRDAGAGRGATTAFLISTPETGVDSISVTWALFDPIMTVARPVVSFLTSVITGMLVAIFGNDEDGSEEKVEAQSCCSSKQPEPEPEVKSCCASKQVKQPGFGDKLIEAARYGFGKLVDDLAMWLLIGFVISGVVAASVPDSFFTDTIPGGVGGMLLMMVVGTPLYICATASTPIAAAMVAKGLSPGAALVFLLVGPATNATTLLIVSRMIGKRGVAIYLVGIMASALIAGFAIDALYETLDLDLTALVAEGMEHMPSTFAQVSGGALIALLVWSMVRQQLKR